ncbi:MAG TPA: glucoamylase family protein [Tepidisphaeraceae bacterium]|jgi:hypothetical protein|nr:glucoamylase family protein [Tepidisphaeraceae bacterium]
MNDANMAPANLDRLQRLSFDYFVHETNPDNGLVLDKTEKGSPASIAAVGLAMSAYPVAVERGFMTRGEAIRRTVATLRFFRDSDQNAQGDATGYKGFYYHFLDMKSGRRSGQCELSTIDTAFLIAGMLTAAAYFGDAHNIEALAEELYARVDWKWALDNGPTLTHGWLPETGFLKYRWEGYNEAMILYLLALGSATHAIAPENYTAWTATYQWRKVGEDEYLHSGPLFTHQISHIWVDFRGIQDAYMRARGIDYFENSRRATYIQQQYAIRNPNQFTGYGATSWGITASDGPGEKTRHVDGRERKFLGYAARGVPDGPDDGTLAPWAAVSSLPFAPEIVLPTLRHFEDIELHKQNAYGFKATFNPTFSDSSNPSHFWVSPLHFGLNQGPVVLMIENYRSGLLWRIMRKCPQLSAGLRLAGFTRY